MLDLRCKTIYKNANLGRGIGVVLLLLFLTLSSCTIQMKVDVSSDEKQKSGMKIVVENTEQKDYQGWWVYGEGQHIFKDETTLEEYDLEFPNENMEELVELYLAVCEMEYFPMECKMIGHLKKEVVEKQTKTINPPARPSRPSRRLTAL